MTLATVSDFDLVEFWCENESNNDFERKFTYSASKHEEYQMMDCLLSSKQVIVGCQILILKIIFMNIIYFCIALSSSERFTRKILLAFRK